MIMPVNTVIALTPIHKPISAMVRDAPSFLKGIHKRVYAPKETVIE